MPADRSQIPRLAVAGVVLLVVGLALCLAYRFSAPDEQHSYSAGAVAPYAVQVTAGRTYHVSIHNGVDAETDLGVAPAALTCTYAAAPASATTLSITAEQSTTKATNVIASFVAPTSGRLHIACAGLSSVFVDDADNASADRSGAYLLLGVIALGIGVPLALSALRTATRRRDPVDVDD